MSSVLNIVQKNSKFIVTKNGEPINLPKTDGQNITTEFSCREDAEKYIHILTTISQRK